MIRQLSSRRVYESPYLRLREDAIEQPDGSRGIYGVVEKPDFALVVPWDGERLHLVGQYRYPVASFEWEFPQGGVEGFVPEQPSEIAARELEEETGLRADRLQHLGRMWHAYGFSQQGFDAFLATGLTAGETRRESVRADDGVAHRRHRRARGHDPVRRAARRAVGRGMGPRPHAGAAAVIAEDSVFGRQETPSPARVRVQ